MRSSTLSVVLNCTESETNNLPKFGSIIKVVVGLVLNEQSGNTFCKSRDAKSCRYFDVILHALLSQKGNLIPNFHFLE